MLSGKEVKAHLDGVIALLDRGGSPAGAVRFFERPLVRTVIVPSALSLSLGVAGCLETEGGVTKAEVESAYYEDRVAEICESLGSVPDCDPCDELGWYEDDACDEFCPADPICTPVARYMAPFEVCDDEIDNDDDGDVDCDDADCASDPACAPVARYMAPFEACDDEVDNDDDGEVDCDDADCASDPVCTATTRYMAPFEVCDDEVDNDDDGEVDCDDADCAGDPACVARYMAPFR